jgi:hypothetical protein
MVSLLLCSYVCYFEKTMDIRFYPYNHVCSVHLALRSYTLHIPTID